MEFALSSGNVVSFLKKHKLCDSEFRPDAPIALKEGTNFNLVVKFPNGRDLIVKQNRIDSNSDRGLGSLPVEWVVQELIDNFSSLSELQPLVSEVIFIDWSNSVLVSVFYENYQALNQLDRLNKCFDPRLTYVIGSNLAKIHGATYQQPAHLGFLRRYLKLDADKKQPNFINRLTKLRPSIWGNICPDGFTFYKLYQRFSSLNDAAIELFENIQPSCLIHNDLTLDNFIIDRQINLDCDSIEIAPEQIKIIDWERIDWGDPAMDLGMFISEYIGGIWLESTISDRNLDLNTMLTTAKFPLETISPALKTFMQGYLSQFPKIAVKRTDFIKRVVQFIGIGILSRLTYYVEHHYPFTNNSIYKLQVAKNLLCFPQESIKTVFGVEEEDLLNVEYAHSLNHRV